MSAVAIDTSPIAICKEADPIQREKTLDHEANKCRGIVSREQASVKQKQSTPPLTDSHVKSISQSSF